jgi:rhodanese-related sulfurtransferase
MTTISTLRTVAIWLGALAAVAGSPYANEHRVVNVDELSSVVAHERDHVSALQLAHWIMTHRAGVRVLDVRSRAEFDEYHIPTAEHVELDTLTQLRVRSSDTLVLYSEGGTHAAQAWFVLRALGYANVYSLREGLYEWLNDVMEPRVVATPATDAGERARRDSVTVAMTYFGGARATGDAADHSSIPLPSSARPATHDVVRRVRRRGC